MMFKKGGYILRGRGTFWEGHSHIDVQKGGIF